MNTSGNNAGNLFSSFFSELVQNRNIPSDERLAQMAAALQDPMKPRINVQARTINNWRNGRSQPRRSDNRQLVLVLKALNATDEERRQIDRLIRAHKVTSQAAKPTPPPASRPRNLRLLVAAAGSMAVSISVAFAFLGGGFPEPSPRYLENIPPGQLRLSSDGFVLPQSDGAALSKKQLEPLTGWELYVARNEIYARYGRPFVKASSICLQKHFEFWGASDDSSLGWYLKRSGEPNLTDLEYRNAEIIRNYECGVRGGQFDCSGLLQACN